MKFALSGVWCPPTLMQVQTSFATICLQFQNPWALCLIISQLALLYKRFLSDYLGRKRPQIPSGEISPRIVVNENIIQRCEVHNFFIVGSEEWHKSFCSLSNYKHICRENFLFFLCFRKFCYGVVHIIIYFVSISEDAESVLFGLSRCTRSECLFEWVVKT